MILSERVASGVADGTITTAFRRWTTARVAAGQVFMSSHGRVLVTSVEVVDPTRVPAEDLRSSGFESLTEMMRTLRGDDNSPVFQIGLAWHSADPRVELSQQAELNPKDRAGIDNALIRLDRRSASGPWTRPTLRAVSRAPGRSASVLAEQLGRDQARLKLDIRKLKALGLTISLTTGYRLSPRGSAYLSGENGPGTAPD